MTSTSHVATLLCDPGFPALAERHIARAMEALETAEPPQWLDQGIAADLFFMPASPIDCRAVTARLCAAIADPQIDVSVQKAAGRRKKLPLVEMDGVLLQQATNDESAAVIGGASQLAEIRAKIAAGAMTHAAGTQAVFALLQGRGTDCLQQVLARRMRMRAGAQLLSDTLQASGARLVLATFGFSCFAGPVAQKANIQVAAANRLIIESDKIAALAEPVLDPAGKAAFLDQLCAAGGITKDEVMVVTPDPADLPLFGKAGQAVAFHADAGVARAADVILTQGDLTALLYVQGYRREDFVAPPRRDLGASDWKRKYGAYEKAHERRRL